MLSIFLNVLAFVAVLVMWVFHSKVEEDTSEEVETEVPKSGKIVLKKDNKMMFSLHYDGLEDFNTVHSAVFVQLLQRKKEGENWIIEVIPS